MHAAGSTLDLWDIECYRIIKHVICSHDYINMSSWPTYLTSLWSSSSLHPSKWLGIPKSATKRKNQKSWNWKRYMYTMFIREIPGKIHQWNIDRTFVLWGTRTSIFNSVVLSHPRLFKRVTWKELGSTQRMPSDKRTRWICVALTLTGLVATRCHTVEPLFNSILN